MISHVFLYIILTFVFVSAEVYSQLKSATVPVKWISWTLLQGLPSPGYYADNDGMNKSLRFTLSWQVIPLSYSFSSNKYLTNWSFFYIKPVKRFSGSAEMFFEPTVATGDYKYSRLRRFQWNSGARVVIPLVQRGEYLCFSLGLAYYNQKSLNGELNHGISYEAGIYSFFGMSGLKFNYYSGSSSRYSLKLYLKYY
jgi:hypothetical protein